MMKNEHDARQARAAMEQAKTQAESASVDSKRPQRYKLYDRIKDHVSLRAVDTVIIVTALLIVAALFYGIATAGPH